MRTFLFQTIHRLVTHSPFLVIALSILLAAVLGGYGAVYMKMVTDQDRLLSEDLDYHRRYEDFKRRFGDLEFLYVVIENGTAGEKIRFAQMIETQLHASKHIERVIYKFDRSWMKPYALYYAPQNEIDRLQSGIQANIDNFKSLRDTPTVDHILYNLSQSLAADHSSPSIQPREDLTPLLNALGGKRDASLKDLLRFPREIEQEFSGNTDYQWLAGKEYLLMLIMPQKDYETLGVVEEPIDDIRTAINVAAFEIPSVKAGLTGRPALQADEMRTTNQDMANASLIAITGVFILFSIFFREIIRPLLTVTALLIAMGWTYGYVALTLGHLNLLSLVFALVLIGLGIDFGIHFLHRYQEELEKSKVSSIAVLGALHGVGSGIITGALTSSVAFLLALFTDFLGLAELGYVAGSGIVFCLVAMLVTLSAFLYSYDKHFRKKEHVPTPVHLAGLRHVSNKPVLMVIGICVVSAFLIPQAMKVHFNDNLLELQAEGLESVEYEHKLIEETEDSTWFCAYLQDSIDEIESTSAELMTKPTVASVSSIADVLPSQPNERHTQLNAIHNTISPLIEKQYPYDPNPAIYTELRQRLNQLFSTLQSKKEMREQLRNNPEMPPRQREQLQAGMTRIPDIDAEVLDQLNALKEQLSGTQDEIMQRLRTANEILLEEPRHVLKVISEYCSQPPPRVEDVSEDLRSLFIGKDGSYLLMAFPKYNIWETHHMRDFIADVREVSDDVTGTPVQVYESSLLMRDAFTTVGLYSILVVALFVFIDFQTFRALFFIMVPLLMGVLWLVEVMGIFGVNLNLANFFAIPILIGIGVDNAVHLYHRYEETGDIEKALYTTGTTLTLTTLTTMTGFGSLMFASHKGLASLGALMAMGSATCWFACVIFMPALIQTVRRS